MTDAEIEDALTYMDDPRSLPTISTNFAGLKEEIDAATRPIAKVTEVRECSFSADVLIEPVEENVEPYKIGKTPHSVSRKPSQLLAAPKVLHR